MNPPPGSPTPPEQPKHPKQPAEQEWPGRVEPAGSPQGSEPREFELAVSATFRGSSERSGAGTATAPHSSSPARPLRPPDPPQPPPSDRRRCFPRGSFSVDRRFATSALASAVPRFPCCLGRYGSTCPSLRRNPTPIEPPSVCQPQRHVVRIRESVEGRKIECAWHFPHRLPQS